MPDLQGLPWHHIHRHGQEVLDGLHALDRRIALDVLAADAAKRAKAEAEKAEHKAEKELQKCIARGAKELDRLFETQRKKALAAERAQLKALEDARKRAEKEEKARRKAEEVAERVRLRAELREEKARKKAEVAAKREADQIREGQRKRTAGEKKRKYGDSDAAKENGAPDDARATKRARSRSPSLEYISASPIPLTPSTAPRPKPKPRPVVKRPTVPVSHFLPMSSLSSHHAQSSTLENSAVMSTHIPNSVSISIGMITPPNSSETPTPPIPWQSHIPQLLWSYPTPSTPNPTSLSGTFAFGRSYCTPGS